jgi:hypothetical protein
MFSHDICGGRSALRIAIGITALGLLMSAVGAAQPVGIVQTQVLSNLTLEPIGSI